jgi:hypothetical protein
MSKKILHAIIGEGTQLEDEWLNAASNGDAIQMAANMKANRHG